MAAQIRCCCLQTSRVILEELTHPAIARVAEQSTHITGLVAMVHNQLPGVPTDSTQTVLLHEHAVVIVNRQPIPTLQAVGTLVHLLAFRVGLLSNAYPLYVAWLTTPTARIESV